MRNYFVNMPQQQAAAAPADPITGGLDFLRQGLKAGMLKNAKDAAEPKPGDVNANPEAQMFTGVYQAEQPDPRSALRKMLELDMMQAKSPAFNPYGGY